MKQWKPKIGGHEKAQIVQTLTEPRGMNHKKEAVGGGKTTTE